MSTISSMLGAEGAPLEIQHNGKTYRFGPITQQVKSAWERSLKNEAFASLNEFASALPPEAQGAAVAALSMRSAAHEFAFFGPVSMAAMRTFAGQAQMAALLTGTTRDEAEALFLARPAQTMAVLESITNESFSAMVAFGKAQQAQKNGQAGPEGNVQAPAA